MDEKNYSLDLEEIYRVAVRGIVFIGGKLLTIEDDLGEVKLPGGGIDSGEDEKKHGFKQVLYTLDEALEKNRIMLEKEGKQAWNQREYKTLLLIREHLRNV